MFRIFNIIAFIFCILWIIYDYSIEAIVVFTATLASFFRDDIHGLIGSNFISLSSKTPLIRNLYNSKYSFIDNQFINPRILDDLIGWLSDSNDQVISINIDKSNNSNRYYGEVEIINKKDNYPIVKIKNKKSTYSYQYIGCSFSGVHIINTWNCSGGSGVFCNILLVTLKNSYTLNYYDNKLKKINTTVITKVGNIGLGDRYSEKVRYNFGILTIPACINKHVDYPKTTRILIV
jgi:hypothetical protein